MVIKKTEKKTDGPRTAEVGDVLTAKAAAKIRKVLGERSPYTTREACTVFEKSDDGGYGRWICIDCGALPENNFSMHSHVAERPRHRIAWHNAKSSRIEVP